MEEKVYTVKDIYRAFDLGLDSAIFVLEKTLWWSFKDRRYLIERLKMMIESKQKHM